MVSKKGPVVSGIDLVLAEIQKRLQIRRVINLRMTGNSIVWKVENAERMLARRGLVLSGR